MTSFIADEEEQETHSKPLRLHQAQQPAVQHLSSRPVFPKEAASSPADAAEQEIFTPAPRKPSSPSTKNSRVRSPARERPTMVLVYHIGCGGAGNLAQSRTSFGRKDSSGWRDSHDSAEIQRLLRPSEPDLRALLRYHLLVAFTPLGLAILGGFTRLNTLHRA